MDGKLSLERYAREEIMFAYQEKGASKDKIQQG